MSQVSYYGTGRRKHSTARVRLIPGNGKIIINERDVKDYIPYDNLIKDMVQPLELTETIDSYDIIATVEGGGFSGQAGAVRHGVSRALLKVDPDFRSILKHSGLLTRDPRMKERKKPGLKKARKAPQFSKR